jgi:thymidylate synthase (FAD)
MNRGSSPQPSVRLLSHSGSEFVAAFAAKLCYSATGIGELENSVKQSEQSSLLKMIAEVGHYSVFEHLSFTFGIEGISRACSHQLVRHRLASYSQKSQRYAKHTGFEFIKPPSIAANFEAEKIFSESIEQLADLYDGLIRLGIPAEDARYVLPNAFETKIIVTMNARELLHFFNLRCCERAQWEIRRVAYEMFDLAYPIAPSVFSAAGPPCVTGVCKEGKLTCGRAGEVRERFVRLKEVER